MSGLREIRVPRPEATPNPRSFAHSTTLSSSAWRAETRVATTRTATRLN
jgi:hypothetical protein